MIALAVIGGCAAYCLGGGVTYSLYNRSEMSDNYEAPPPGLIAILWWMLIPVAIGAWSAGTMDRLLDRRKAKQLPKATAKELR